jgi:hypothetical protein
MSIANRIKEIIMEFIKDQYFGYLSDQNLLLIENDKLKSVITDFYNFNSKNLKVLIREKLKNEMKTTYPTASVENTLYDIFEDSTFNINRIVLEIENYQKSIINIFKIKVFDKNLGIKIKIDNYVEIISAENPNINDTSQTDIYNNINNYKYIYSINDTILSELDKNEKINVIKNNVNNYQIIELKLVKKD